MGGVVSGIGNALGSVWDAVKPLAPIAGGIVGDAVGGPWGAALGSGLGEAVAGGNVKQDVTAGALGGLGSWAAGGFSGLGSGAGSATGTAATEGSAPLYSLGAGGAGAAGSAASEAPWLSSPSVWQSLGASTGGDTATALGSSLGGAAASSGGGGSWTDAISNLGKGALGWAERNPGTALQLGAAALSGMQTPKLPSALQQLQGISAQNLGLAENIIKSGGTAAPGWAGQKQSIDQSIDLQVKQAEEAILQHAANSGLSADSMVVQQQIAQMKSQAETQRNSLYQQATNQNVQQAMSLLSGGSQALGQIGSVQLQQDQQAQQLAGMLAGNALETYGKQQPSA